MFAVAIWPVTGQDLQNTTNAQQSNILIIVIRIKHWRYWLGLSVENTN